MRRWFLSAALASLVGGPALAQIAPDGLITEPEYLLLATDDGGPGLGFGPDNQLNAIYAHVVPTSATTGVLYLGIAGKLERNDDSGNRVSAVVFLDTRAGGYGDGNFGRADGPDFGNGVTNFNSGHVFNEGFLADYALQIGCGWTPTDCYFNLYTLSGSAGNGGGPNLYLGSANTSPMLGASLPADGDSRTQGFEIALTYSADGVGADLALDRTSVQAFALITGASGFLSNQFLTPTNATDGNYGFDAVDFNTKAASPVTLAWQTIAGRAGWRHLAWPVDGGTVADLAAQNFVQGTAQSYPNGGPNVIRDWGGTAWVYATSNAEPLFLGDGAFWYHYDAADFPGGVPMPEWRPRPYTIRAGGVEPQEDVVFFKLVSPDEFYLLGNPYAVGYDLSWLDVISPVRDASAAAGLPMIGPLAWVWDPDAGTAGAYVVRDLLSENPADRSIAHLQGVMVERTAPGPVPIFRFNHAGRLAPGTFLGREGGAGRTPLTERRTLGLELVRETPDGPVVEDQVARLLLSADGTDGFDMLDARRPPTVGTVHASLAFAGQRADGSPAWLAQDSRPLDPAGQILAPLALRIAGLPDGATYRLRWPRVENVPASWTLRLRDTETGALVDLRTAPDYAFTASNTDWTQRFVLEVLPSLVTAEAAPQHAEVGPATPNPSTITTRVRVAVPAPEGIRAELFDALGRRVAVVFDGTVAAEATLAVDVAGLAPGAYVLRVVGSSFSATRAVTVVR